MMSTNRTWIYIWLVSCVSFACGTLVLHYPWIIAMSIPVGWFIDYTADRAGVTNA